MVFGCFGILGASGKEHELTFNGRPCTWATEKPTKDAGLPIVLFVGLNGSGKTAAIASLTRGQRAGAAGSKDGRGINLPKAILRPTEHAQLSFVRTLSKPFVALEAPGAPAHRPGWPAAAGLAHAVVLCVSCTDTLRFPLTREMLWRLLPRMIKHAVPCLVLATRRDEVAEAMAQAAAAVAAAAAQASSAPRGTAAAGSLNAQPGHPSQSASGQPPATTAATGLGPSRLRPGQSADALPPLPPGVGRRPQSGNASTARPPSAQHQHSQQPQQPLANGHPTATVHVQPAPVPAEQRSTGLGTKGGGAGAGAGGGGGAGTGAGALGPDQASGPDPGDLVSDLDLPPLLADLPAPWALRPVDAHSFPEVADALEWLLAAVQVVDHMRGMHPHHAVQHHPHHGHPELSGPSISHSHGALAAFRTANTEFASRFIAERALTAQARALQQQQLREAEEDAAEAAAAALAGVEEGDGREEEGG